MLSDEGKQAIQETTGYPGHVSTIRLFTQRLNGLEYDFSLQTIIMSMDRSPTTCTAAVPALHSIAIGGQRILKVTGGGEDCADDDVRDFDE